MAKLYTCLCLVICLIGKDIVRAGICDTDKKPFIFRDIRIKVYKGNSTNYTIADATLSNPEKLLGDLVPSKPSIIYIHGFLENANFENTQVVVKAYLDRGDVNVIALDWGEVTLDVNYILVADKAMVVGKAAAEALNKLSSVINLKKLHVIGHSLGAHVGAQIGRYLNVTLERITGLDPALPLFYPSTCHIRAGDAENVVILHTDGGFYGTPIDTGSVDFYANKGVSPQPGCPVIIGAEFCSHQRATKLFAESLANPKAFPAYKCSNDTLKKINGGRPVHFSEATPNKLQGTYCFETNPKSPYGRKGSA